MSGTTTRKTLEMQNRPMMILGARNGGFQSHSRYAGVYRRSNPNETKALIIASEYDDTIMNRF